MTAKRRSQTDRSAATRDALVQVARALFAEHGYGGVGTEAIARAAGVTRGALYHQFVDKTDLFAAVVEAVEAEVTGRIDTAVSTSAESDVIAMMKLGAHTWLRAFAEPATSRILLVDAPSVLGWERWREIGRRYGMGLVESLISHAISVGRIAPQPVAPLSHVMIGALDEAALYVVQQEDQDIARAEVGAVIAALIDSFAA